MSNKLTNEEIKKLIGNRKLLLHKCNMCNYECGWFYRDNQLYYDNGCNCGVGRHITKKNENDIQDFFEMNQHINPKKYIEENLC